MATAQMPRVDDIRLDANPQTFALRFIEGKAVASRYPGGRVMFTAVDSRKLFLNDEEASEFEHALRDLRVEPADFIQVARVTHGRGGGYSIRVKRIDEPADPAPVREPQRETRTAPTREEALLAKSVEMAREHGAQAFHAAKPAPASAPTAAHNLMGSFTAAIDAIHAAQKYADEKGLKVTFTSEDVRATAISAFIQIERAAMGSRY
jgi:hypothetical protein